MLRSPSIVLDEKTEIFGDPQRRHPGVERGVADDDLALRRGGEGFKTMKRYE